MIMIMIVFKDMVIKFEDFEDEDFCDITFMT